MVMVWLIDLCCVLCDCLLSLCILLVLWLNANTDQLARLVVYESCHQRQLSCIRFYADPPTERETSQTIIWYRKGLGRLPSAFELTQY